MPWVWPYEDKKTKKEKENRKMQTEMKRKLRQQYLYQIRDFKTRERRGHYVMIKGLIQQEGITIVNIYVPNIGRPKYINNHKRRN